MSHTKQKTTPTVVIPKNFGTGKISPRLFVALREQLNQIEISGQIQPTKKQQEQHSQRVHRAKLAALRKLGVTKLAEAYLGQDSYRYNYPHMNEISETINKAQNSVPNGPWVKDEELRLLDIKNMRKQIDAAELSFLAGDSGPAQQLIEAVNNLGE